MQKNMRRKQNRVVHFLLSALVFAMLLGLGVSSAMAQEMGESNAVSVISGGAEDDGIARMNAVAHNYNLKLIFTSMGGDYLSGIDVIIRDKHNVVYVNQSADGPLMFVKLKTGAYTVEATYGNLVRTQNLVIPKSGKQRNFLLRFPTQQDEGSNVTLTPMPAEVVETTTHRASVFGKRRDCVRTEQFIDGNIIRTTTCRIPSKKRK
jgi:hypothetical protein